MSAGEKRFVVIASGAGCAVINSYIDILLLTSKISPFTTFPLRKEE